MLEIQTSGSGIVEMAVRGELDMHKAPQMRAALTAVLNRGDVTGINLDLSALTVLDATGVGTIIVAHRIATNVRVDLRLTAVSPLAARLLRLTGAEALLPSRRSPPAGHAADSDGRPGYAGHVSPTPAAGVGSSSVKKRRTSILGALRPGSPCCDPHVPTPDDRTGDVLAQGTSS